MSRSPSAPALDSALALHRAGRLAEAETAYRACMQQGDADAAAPLAALLLQNGRYGEAMHLLQPLFEAEPDNAEVAANLSLALRREGHLDGALAAAERAARLAPARASAWNALGLARLEAGRIEDAFAAFDAGVHAAPDNYALRLQRARCLLELRRFSEAADGFAALTRTHADLREPWAGLGDAQAALGQHAAAAHSRAQVAALALRDDGREFQRGQALIDAGDGENAAKIFRRLLASARISPPLCWFWLGRAQAKAGDMDNARASFAKAVEGEPDNSSFLHFHAASTGQLPDTVERDYIASLFDVFADHFEQTLVEHLAYATPSHLARLLDAHGAAGEHTVRVLDLGCGTGLMGVALARPGRTIDGVDLSPRMLEQARAKGVYRELHAAELVAFLDGATASWDLILAADVFVYVASLAPVVDAVAARLAPGGAFAFSLECSTSDGTELSVNTGRYRHVPAAVSASLQAAGFTDIVIEDVVLRHECGEPVHGAVLLARRSPH